MIPRYYNTQPWHGGYGYCWSTRQYLKQIIKARYTTRDDTKILIGQSIEMKQEPKMGTKCYT